MDPDATQIEDVFEQHGQSRFDIEEEEDETEKLLREMDETDSATSNVADVTNAAHVANVENVAKVDHVFDLTGSSEPQSVMSSSSITRKRILPFSDKSTSSTTPVPKKSKASNASVRKEKETGSVLSKATEQGMSALPRLNVNSESSPDGIETIGINARMERDRRVQADLRDLTELLNEYHAAIIMGNITSKLQASIFGSTSLRSSQDGNEEKLKLKRAIQKWLDRL